MVTLPEPHILEVLEKCQKSVEYFAKTIFPDTFTRPFSSGHREIFKVLDDDSVRKAVILAPRCFGKTSIVQLAYPAREILLKNRNFVVTISASVAKATTNSDNLKSALVENDRIVQAFGSLKSKHFGSEYWETNTGVKVQPFGGEQNVRGPLYKSKRPDLIIVDDVEDEELVANPERRKKLMDWVLGSVCKLVDIPANDFKIVVIGSLLHEDSLLANLKGAQGWTTVEVAACDSNYQTLHPEFLSTEQLAVMVEEARSLGKLGLFTREMMNLVMPEEDATFTRDMFTYYEESELFNKHLETVVIVDPAKTVDVKSDYTAIVCLSVDTRNRAIYVRDVCNQKLHPREIYQKTLQMAKHYDARTVGLEVNSLSGFITHPFKDYMLAQGSVFELVELKARGKKENRIAALSSYYRRGLIKHNRAVTAVLEGQLLSFPRAKNDDVSDAVAYIIQMLSISGRYLTALGESQSQQLHEEVQNAFLASRGEWKHQLRSPATAGGRYI